MADAGDPDRQAAQSAAAPNSDAWFRSVVEAANEGIWIIDTAGRTIFANERMATMLATTPLRMMGRSPIEFLPADEQERGAQVIARNLEGTPVEFEIRFNREDGRQIPALAGSAPLRDENGRITGSIATFSDLTNRKQAEEALRAQEADAKSSAALLNQLLESAADAIWMRDASGVFQLANPAARAIMNGMNGDVIGRSTHEIWGDSIGARLATESERLFREGRAVSVEEEMFHAGLGCIRTFLSNKVPVFAPDGSRVGILGISRDITDRKQVENVLRDSEARLAAQVAELNALYDSAPIGLAFFSRDYRYLRINRELAQINGVPAEEHIGRTIREVLSANAPFVEPIIDKIFATGEAVRDLEVSGETPQQPGISRHWLTGFYPVLDGSGEVHAVGAWVIEITERKRAEEREFLLAREVDHRAKNLLAVVQSIVQLTPGSDGQELKTSVIGRIQALARAHSLLSESRWDGVMLGQLIAEELAPFTVSRSERVTCDGPSFMLRPAAAQSLALVLHELATNAAKYGALSSPSGSLHIEWQRLEDERGAFIELRWAERGGPLVVSPEELGFGSDIIRASVERQLRGRVTKDWQPEGLVCTLRIPAAEIAPGGERPPEK